MCGPTQAVDGKSLKQAPLAEPSAWSAASILALVVMNAALVAYLSLVVPALRGSSRWLVYGIMAYIGCLGVSQLADQLGTGSGTNYGKFATGTDAKETKSLYAQIKDTLSGPTLPVSVSWWTMEQPSFWVPFVFQVLSISRQGFHSGNVFLLMMMVHYSQRSFIFPFLSRGRPFPVLHWFLAFVFCTSNGTMQSLDLLYGGMGEGSDPLAEVKTLRAALGMLIFAFGMYTNVRCDQILRNLREPGDRGYKIPRGGMFEFISGANLWGECIEWLGFAIACGSSPTAWCFSAFNWIGIGGRAVATHDWYMKKFGDEYGALNRQRLIPFIW